MKKSILFVAALALTFAACNNNEPEQEAAVIVAGFEEAAISPAEAESVFEYTTDGTYALESGSFKVDQCVAYGGTYTYAGIVSNITSNTYNAGDYSHTNTCKSAAGGAYEGSNYIVWYEDSYNPGASIKLTEPAQVPGMYICNTPWVVDAILNGDGMSADGGAPFGDDDYLTLTISGYLAGSAVNAQVNVDLAKGKEYIKDWTYVDLSELGKIDEMKFSFTGSKQNSSGLTSPTYIAIDNLGAKRK